MTDAGSERPCPVLGRNETQVEVGIEAFVGELTTVGPVGVHTREIREGIERKEVAGGAAEVVDAKLNAVLGSGELDASGEAVGGFPLQLGVTDIAEGLTGNAVEHLACHEIGAGHL